MKRKSRKKKMLIKYMQQNNNLLFTLSIVSLFLISCGNNTSEGNTSENNSSNETQKTECIGDQNCISDVRNNFTNTNKTILNESYEGEGIFKITALDPQRGVTFNATVKTDCNCTVLDVQISDID
ncbi:hypothetical protein [Daejeonella sp.]|uniref:hypothetical protein n=1 Tax=Daejeonella sp. TaxID=2805397 RepID=UPI0037BE4443